MSRPIASFCLAAMVIALTGAGVATAQDRASNSAQSEPGDATFRAGYSKELNGNWRVELYSAPPRSGMARYVARRALILSDGTAEQIQWTTDIECGPLVGVVESLNNLSMPSIRFPNLAGVTARGSSFPAPPGIATDAAHYSIWGKAAQSDGSFANILVSSNHGLIAAWVEFAESAMAGCWRGQQPA